MVRILIAMCSLILLSSVIVLFSEPNITTLGDAVWWSFVTATTVGYGDISPETALGRITAVILMISGIGTISLVTGFIANFLMHGGKRRPPVVIYIEEKLRDPEKLTVDDLEEIIALLETMKDDVIQSKK